MNRYRLNYTNYTRGGYGRGVGFSIEAECYNDADAQLLGERLSETFGAFDSAESLGPVAGPADSLAGRYLHAVTKPEG